VPKHYAYSRSSPSFSVFSLLRWWFSRHSRLSSCPSPLLIALIKSCSCSSNAEDQLQSVPQSSPVSVSVLAFEANGNQSVNWGRTFWLEQVVWLSVGSSVMSRERRCRCCDEKGCLVRYSEQILETEREWGGSCCEAKGVLDMWGVPTRPIVRTF
jgi:hypothetical protein